MSTVLRKLLWLTQRRRREQDLRDELQFHLNEEAQENPATNPQKDLGNIALIAEDTRAAWGWPFLESLWLDLRYSARTLRRAPGFTAAAVLSLALGIGANTAIFSLLNAMVLRLLPIPNPHELVQLNYTLPLWETNPNNFNSFWGYPEFEILRDQTKSLSGLFTGTSVGRVSLAWRNTSTIATADAYTPTFFTTLGLTPQKGRFFSPDEDTANSTVAVLSDRAWRSQFAADPSILGVTVAINQVPFTIIGVAPEGFTSITLGSAPDLWIPLHAINRVRQSSYAKIWTEPFNTWLLLAGRLRPGFSPQQAQAELDLIHRREIAVEAAASEPRVRENIAPFLKASHVLVSPAGNGTYSGMRERYTLPLKLLMALAAAVLLAACANLANLLLARATRRRPEIALRMALGAGRFRVIRRFLIENLLLALAGGALAILLAWLAGSALVAMVSAADSPAPLSIRPDARILAFTAAASLLTCLLFGLWPAFRATRLDPSPRLKERGHNFDRVLIIAQIAFSVALVTSAGLFARTLEKLWNVNVGYSRDNILLFSVDARLAGYSNQRAAPLYREILDRLAAIPGVESAAASIVRPVDDQFYLTNRIQYLDGRLLPPSDIIKIAWNDTTPGYFSTISTPILAGRDFDIRDDATAPKVVIVNQTLASKAFPGQNPIGHSIDDNATIIGVVKDSLYNGPHEEPRPVLYHPLFQYGIKQGWVFLSFEIRQHPGQNIVEAVRREVAAVNRNLPLFRVNTLRAQTDQSLTKERLLATISGFFGALALLLACVGLYGLMAWAVARRTSEIGIRLALGARRDNIIWLVCRETLFLTTIGIATGVALALWSARYAKSLLFEITPNDPAAISISVVTLIAVAILAALVPIRRALKLDPAIALRYD